MSGPDEQTITEDEGLPALDPAAVTPIEEDDEYAPRPIDEEVREASKDYRSRAKTKDEWIAERLKKRDGAHQRALAERDERIAALERRFQEGDSAAQKRDLETDLQKLTTKREALRRQWIEATEQGRTEEAAKINEEIGEVVFDMRSTRTVMDARAAAPPPAPAVAPRLDTWAKAVGYQTWTEDERQIAAGIDRALTRSGLKHSDDAYYTEMTRRLTHAIPERADVIAQHAPVEDDDEEDAEEKPAPTRTKGKKTVEAQPQTTRRLPGVASVANDPRATASDDLPKEYHGAMRKLGLDSADASVRKAFRESMVRKGYLPA